MQKTFQEPSPWGPAAYLKHCLWLWISLATVIIIIAEREARQQIWLCGEKCKLAYIYICHPSPSNGQHEPTNSMKNVTPVTRLLLTCNYLVIQSTAFYMEL